MNNRFENKTKTITRILAEHDARLLSRMLSPAVETVQYTEGHEHARRN